MSALFAVAIDSAMTPPRALPCEQIHPFDLPPISQADYEVCITSEVAQAVANTRYLPMPPRWKYRSYSHQTGTRASEVNPPPVAGK
jgi:hypothetical protein